MSEVSKSKQDYYPFLDGYRAIAVLWVIFYHMNIYFNLEPFFGKYYLFAFKFFNVGHLGVDMFFVISGFLISGLLLPDLRGAIRIKRFYLRRFFKIVPPYVVALLAGMAINKYMTPYVLAYVAQDGGHFRMFTTSSHNPAASFLSYFLLIQNFSDQIPIVQHTWSLAVEEHFYLVYPILLTLVCLVRKEERARRQMLLGIFCILILLCHLWRRYVAFWGGTNLTTFFRFDALVFGCLLKLLEPKLMAIPRERWQAVAFTARLAGMLIFLGFVIVGFKRNNLWAYTWAYVGAGLILLSFLNGASSSWKVIFENRYMRWIGHHSYGIYLWHILIIFPFSKLAQSLPHPAFPILYVACSIGAGYLSTITIERYSLALRQKIAP